MTAHPHAATLGRILAPLEASFAIHGARPEGLRWPNAEDLARRYEALLTPLLPSKGAPPLALLDFGCGAGFLPDWLLANGLMERVEYTGLDISAPILAEARARHSGLRFLRADILRDGVPQRAGGWDAILVCGVLNVRFANSHAAMRDFARSILTALWPHARHCLAFNAMAKHVQWEREDLFHWPVEEVLCFCRDHLARHVTVRADYGLWENGFHVWRTPRVQGSAVPACWRDPAA